MVNVSTLDLLDSDFYAEPPTGRFEFVIDDLPFTDGHYFVTVVLQAPTETREYDRDEQRLSFEVFTGEPVIGPVRLDLRLATDLTAPAPTVR